MAIFKRINIVRKIYIIDTSVLVHDPNSYKSFSGNNVIIPITVLDELDKLKTKPGEVGKNARVCIRALEELSKKGEIHKGIQIENDILLKVDTSAITENFGNDKDYGDNKILACASQARKGRIKKTVVLVSRDVNLRFRARAFEMQAEDYEKDATAVGEIYSGYKVIVNEELGEQLDAKQYLDVKISPELSTLLPNECVHFITPEQDGISIGKRVGDKIKIVNIKSPWGLNLRNKEQAFAADMLCDPGISLVTLIGSAGTGKTLTAIASGLEMVLEKRMYNKLVIYRPIQPVGNDIGYLPGTMQEKLAPWMSAITDSFEFLFEAKQGNRWEDNFLMYQEKKKIQMEAITYIRGRSIPKAFIIVDECQNLTKEDVKTILTRASAGTKIVLTGDIEQIDNRSLDATNNGLTYIVEKFKETSLAGHVTFTKCERSELASKAAELL